MTLFVVGVFLVVIFYAIISLYFLPFFVIYQHLRYGNANPRFANRPGAFAGWGFLLLLGWSFSSMVYVFRFMDKRGYRFHAWIGAITQGMAILTIVGLGFSYRPYIMPMLQAEVLATKQKLAQAQNPDAIKQEELGVIYNDLDAISKSYDVNPLIGFQIVTKNRDLVSLLKIYTKDKSIRREKLDRWASIYNTLRLVDEQKLSEFVRETDHGREPASLPIQ